MKPLSLTLPATTPTLAIALQSAFAQWPKAPDAPEGTMVFTARQIAQKRTEQRSKSFFFFQRLTFPVFANARLQTCRRLWPSMLKLPQLRRQRLQPSRWLSARF